jgi:hypothetical protein
MRTRAGRAFAKLAVLGVGQRNINSADVFRVDRVFQSIVMKSRHAVPSGESLTFFRIA